MPGSLLWTITSFTAGHSVTLALASLGVVHVPQAPIEAAIALSIYFLASCRLEHLFLGSSPPGVRKKNVGAGARPRAG